MSRVGERLKYVRQVFFSENKTSSSCIHSIPSCSSPVTLRWMQKRGFPAAAILALLVLAAGLLVVALKLIYRQLDRRANQQSLLVSQTA